MVSGGTYSANPAWLHDNYVARQHHFSIFFRTAGHYDCISALVKLNYRNKSILLEISCVLKTIISPQDHQLRVKHHSHTVGSASVCDVTGLSEPTGTQISHPHTGTSPDSLEGPMGYSWLIVLSHGTHETQPCEPDRQSPLAHGLISTGQSPKERHFHR